MNISTLVGFLSAITVFATALAMSAKNIGVFFDMHAVLIVIGGTMAASFTCFSLPKVLSLLKVFARRMIGTNKKDYQKIILEILSLSQSARRGQQALEAEIKKITDQFLKDAAEILFWAEAEISPEKMRYLLETRAETHYERYMEEANIFHTMSKFPPAFGLMGTSLGMIVLLQSLGGSDAKNTIGPSMSIALVATLYGIAISNFILIPIAENLKKQTKEDLTARKMVVEGVMLIAAQAPTKFIEAQLRSFLLPGERENLTTSSGPGVVGSAGGGAGRGNRAA